MGTVETSSELAEVSNPFSVNNPDALIVDPDTRSYITPANRFSWPSRSSVLIMSNGAGVCTGQMIGRRTFVTSAHCFYKKGAWINPPTHTGLGRVTYRTSSSSPWTEYYSTGAGNGTYYTGCLYYWIPTAWITSGEDPIHDYAVLEYACNLNPGDATGYALPSYSNSYSDYQLSGSNVLVGYDDSGYNPVSVNYSYPSLLYRSNSAGQVAVAGGFAGAFLRSFMDASGGSSGSGLLQWLWGYYGNYNLYFTGVLSRGEGPNSDNVLVRRFDATFSAFLAAYSTEY